MTAPRTGKQIELTVRQQRADQNTRWVGTSLKRFEAANTNERRDVLQWSWIHGSKRKNAVRMKLAAAKEFGATGMVFNPRGFGVAGEDLAVMRREMRSIYVETQRELRAKGVKSVHLFRGVGPNAVPNSIESWTTDVSVAEDFARRQGPEGRVLEENFRSANVLNYRGSSNWTDGIHGDQSEFIIIRDD